MKGKGIVMNGRFTNLKNKIKQLVFLFVPMCLAVLLFADIENKVIGVYGSFSESAIHVETNEM